MADNLPTPESRKETFLAKAAGESVTLPDPASREELFLKAIAENGGGGGGGTAYSAGDGIVIDNDEISVDLVQSTGSSTTKVMSQKAVTDALASAGKVTELTSADYNYPEDNPNSVALWKLPAGLYYRDNSVAAWADTSRYLVDGQNFIQVMETSGSSFVKINIMGTSGSANNGVYQTLQSFMVSSSGGISDFGGALTTSNLKQATGTSTTDVMSQNATTSMVFADPGDGTSGTNDKIRIGRNTSTIGDYSVVVGANSRANGSHEVVLGDENKYFGSDPGTICLGAQSGANITAAGMMDIGSANTSYGYNNSNYRLLTGVHDPVNAHDAATKGYVDAIAGGVTELTSADYNYPANNPNGVALWSLKSGVYYWQVGVTVYSQQTTTTNSAGIAIVTNADAAPTMSSAARILLMANDGAFKEGDTTAGVQYLPTVLTAMNVKDTLTSTSTWEPLSAKQGKVLKDLIDSSAIGTTESYTIATNSWSALSASSPYTYSATVTATYTIGNNTIAELINDNAVTFSNYGFAIGSISGQNVTIYSIGQPDASVTLKVNYKG